MKTRNIILAAIAASAAFVSCNKTEVETALVPMTFTAGYEDINSSKVGFDSSMKTVWQADDQISILAGDYTTSFDVNPNDVGKTNATFTGNTVQSASYYAVYPYSSDYLVDQAYPVVIKKTQSSKAGTFDKTSAPYVAGPVSSSFSGTEHLNFKAVCAYLKFTIGQDNYNAIKVTTLAGSELNAPVIAGNVTVNVETAAFTPSNDASASVELKGSISSGKTYYIAVLPVTFKAGQGFTVEVTNHGASTVSASYTYTFSQETTLERNKYYTVSLQNQ